MSYIKTVCPECGKTVKLRIGEEDYNDIVKQVRDIEFSDEVEKRLEEIRKTQDAEKKLAVSETEKVLKEEIENLRKEANIKIMEADKKTTIEKARADSLEKELENAKKIAISEMEAKMIEQLNAKDREIEQARSELKNKETEKLLEIEKIKNSKEAENVKIKNDFELFKKESELKQKVEKENFELQLKQKDEVIEQYKDFKMKQSVKLLGETLEQHCQNEFNKVRTTMFPNAYFEKDNKVSEESGSKGDFIFRDYVDGVETTSIMFDMKNEGDETKTKHKNEDFLKELDKDRNEKGCEYAVLVSMLEKENEFYNNGIVDVSYKYPKMFIIRPNYFIQIISLIASMARNNVENKKELIKMQEKNFDIVSFDKMFVDWKEDVKKTFGFALKNREAAYKQLDDAEKAIQNMRNFMDLMFKQVGTGTKKIEGMTTEKLAKDSPNLLIELKEKKEVSDE